MRPRAAPHETTLSPPAHAPCGCSRCARTRSFRTRGHRHSPPGRGPDVRERERPEPTLLCWVPPSAAASPPASQRDVPPWTYLRRVRSLSACRCSLTGVEGNPRARIKFQSFRRAASGSLGKSATLFVPSSVRGSLPSSQPISAAIPRALDLVPERSHSSRSEGALPSNTVGLNTRAHVYGHTPDSLAWRLQGTGTHPLQGLPWRDTGLPVHSG